MSARDDSRQELWTAWTRLEPNRFMVFVDGMAWFANVPSASDPGRPFGWSAFGAVAEAILGRGWSFELRVSREADGSASTTATVTSASGPHDGRHEDPVAALVHAYVQGVEEDRGHGFPVRRPKVVHASPVCDMKRSEIVTGASRDEARDSPADLLRAWARLAPDELLSLSWAPWSSTRSAEGLDVRISALRGVVCLQWFAALAAIDAARARGWSVRLAGWTDRDGDDAVYEAEVGSAASGVHIGRGDRPGPATLAAYVGALRRVEPHRTLS